MKTKIIILLSVIVFLISGVIGVSKKGSYTNIGKDKESFMTLQIASYPESMIEIISNGGYEEIWENECQYILKVKAVSELQIITKRTKQDVIVERVIRGDRSIEGTNVTIMQDAGRLFFSEEMKSINMGFVNGMKLGEEYLVFVEKKVETLDEFEQVFIVPGTNITPIFAYKDIENAPTGTNTTYAYSEICENEFFGQTQAVVDAWEDMKARIMEKYADN